ncbi:hypothetical protein [Buttiauxella ferragutiae]|uniref:hypothetical protein n=1 Tax=Buttiauxella ferragutiae TaxID=82989 RepID=UPI0035243A03
MFSHEHVEGGITPNATCKLARKYGVTIPEDYLDLSGRKVNIDNSNFSSFIKVCYFSHRSSVMKMITL